MKTKQNKSRQRRRMTWEKYQENMDKIVAEGAEVSDTLIKLIEFSASVDVIGATDKTGKHEKTSKNWPPRRDLPKIDETYTETDIVPQKRFKWGILLLDTFGV